MTAVSLRGLAAEYLEQAALGVTVAPLEGGKVPATYLTTTNAGVTEVDFGAFPGASDAKVTITGQTGILAGSKVKAYLMATATTDHSADEHWVETLNVMAGNIVPGTGFDIYVSNASALSEPVAETWAMPRSVGPGVGKNAIRPDNGGGRGTRIYGKWTVAWEWV